MTAPVPPDLEETNVLRDDGGAPPGGPADPEPPPSRRFGWGLLLGVLVVLAVAGAATAAWFAAGGGDGRDSAAAPATTAPTRPADTQTALLPPNRVFVPDVTGLKEREAAGRLATAGLEPEVKRKASAKPTGTVLAQTPKAGKKAKKGSTVQIVVDAGAARKVVPDVTGLPVAAAGVRLKKAGFTAKTTGVTTSDAEPGTVVAQAPDAGSKAKQGALVTLSVARQAQSTAATTTTATTSGSQTTSAPTTTAAQPPPPPQPQTATVPDLAGQELADAADVLEQAGIYPDVAYIPSDEPIGTVVAQAKQAGTEVPRGSYVRVNVAEGANPPADAAVPDVRGQPRADAMHALSGAGFNIKVVERPISSSRPADTVINEQPTGGATIPRGALVILIVGKHQGR